jgi:hypothetical protein
MRIIIALAILGPVIGFAPSSSPKIMHKLASSKSAPEPAAEAKAEAAPPADAPAVPAASTQAAPPPPAVSSTPVAAAVVDIKDWAGVQAPTGFFDPLGFAGERFADVNPSWLRAAELKHGRVAMLASTGWLVQAAGIHFPGYLSVKENVAFEDLSKVSPGDAWDLIPEGGKWQIIGLALAAEFAAESQQPHYLNGGKAFVFDPLGIHKVMKPEQYRIRENKELANGRLAMLGVASFWAAHTIPGSAPALPSVW